MLRMHLLHEASLLDTLASVLTPAVIVSRTDTTEAVLPKAMILPCRGMVGGFPHDW